MKIITSEIIDKAEDLYKEGVSLADIGKQLNISPYGTLSKKLKERGVKIIARNPAIKYTVDEEYFHTINCEEKAYWLGFLMADGYVYQQRKKTDGKLKSRLELGLSSVDEGHIKKFLNSVKSNNPINHRVYRRSDKKYIGPEIPSDQNIENFLITSVTEIYKKRFVDGLIKQGCVQKKSKIIEWPNNLPVALERHFVRGYFDGDGSVFKTSTGIWGINFSSSSELFIKSIQQKIKKNGIESSIYSHKTFNILKVKKDSNRKAYKYMYENINVCLDRKLKKFNKMINNL